MYLQTRACFQIYRRKAALLSSDLSPERAAETEKDIIDEYSSHTQQLSKEEIETPQGKKKEKKAVVKNKLFQKRVPTFFIFGTTLSLGGACTTSPNATRSVRLTALVGTEGDWEG